MFIKNNFIVTLTPRHNGMEEGKITIIDRIDNFLELNRRESYLQHSFGRFTSNRFSECFVDVLVL